MKLFAIITAAVMSTAGGAYYYTNNGCPFQGACEKAPVSSSACTSCNATATPSCCELPCPGCATDCRECCDDCELCCSAGATVSVSTTAEKAPCCAACSPTDAATDAASAAAAGAGVK
jgi:hypothetical protein